MKKILVGLTVISLLCMGAWVMNTPSAAAQDTVTWRMSCHYPAASASFKDSVQVVASMVKERTDGKFIIDVHPAGAILPGPEGFNAVKRGMIPIAVTSSAYDLAQVPLFNLVVGLPFAFASEWEGVYFHHWLGFEKMVQEDLSKNHGLMYFSDRI